MLAYKFKANAEGTIDLISALTAAGVSCGGCGGSSRQIFRKMDLSHELCAFARPWAYVLGL